MQGTPAAQSSRLRIWLISSSATRAAWIVWLLVFVGGSIRGLVRPSGVTKVYREAAALWNAGEPLYTDGIHGFLYLPHCAVLSQPLLWGNFQVTEVGWRLGSVGLFAWGVFSLSRLLRRHWRVELFAMATFVGVWPVLGCAGNGQATLLMGACMMLATVACAERRWWAATTALMVAVALKPLALVMVLLVGAVYWRTMAWRLVVGAVALFAAPFLLQSVDYVWRQYALAMEKMSVSGSAETSEFVASDLSGMLASFGIATEPGQLLPVRAAAALLTACLAWWGRRRWPEPLAAFLLFTLATSYLMLFNPRNESNTYAVVAPAVALFAAWEFLVERRRALLPLGVLFLQATCNLYRGLMPGVQFWLKPATLVVFFGYLVVRILFRAPPVIELHVAEDAGS